MPYRTLLVALDTHPLCAERSRVAIELARRLECHLVGVAPTGLIELPPAPGAAAALSAFADRAWEVLLQQARAAAARFEADCRAAGLGAFEAVVEQADTAPALIRHAHRADLTVLSQADPAKADHRAAQVALEQVLFHSARPALVLPYAGRSARIGHRVMVAWDDSREAVRAVADALPLLRRAERVRLVRWDEAGSDDGNDRALHESLAAQVGWLVRHGAHRERTCQGR